MALIDRIALSALPLIPTPVMRRLAGRYIAGETLPEAIDTLERLRQRGHPGIVDLLGEDVHDEAQARSVVAKYAETARAIADHKLDAYVSVKPTHVGLKLSSALAFEIYDQLAHTTAVLGLGLRVEMEDHPTTDATLEVFERLRKHHAHVGIVLQARLFRTLADIEALAPGPLNVRLVKGIYLEPASIAHTAPEPIRDAFVECAKLLARRRAFLALATHDDSMAPKALAVLKAAGYSAKDYEFQVLLGVREPLWATWQAAGHRVRVYVPYGPEWRPYSTRRLRKNPQVFRHVMRDTLMFWKR